MLRKANSAVAVSHGCARSKVDSRAQRDLDVRNATPEARARDLDAERGVRRRRRFAGPGPVGASPTRPEVPPAAA